MPPASEPLRKLGFLTIGLFDEADPRAGHESTLRVIELGEQLGFDSAWVRHRHLQYGISSPVAVLAAASQRTRRIELGTAVIPLGWENPLRLAEDLATVDLLAGGRLNPGVSVGPPTRYDQVRDALYPDTADVEDFGYERVRRLLSFVRGESATATGATEGFEVFSPRVQPHSAGLSDRMWYGGASLRSARWAGEQGMNFLTSSVIKAEEPQEGAGGPGPEAPAAPEDAAGADDDGGAAAATARFAALQLAQIRAFRARHPAGDRARVSQGLVVIPTDSATSEQRSRYEEFARKRLPRTASPQGPGRMLFAPDLVGESERIAEVLHAHAAFREIDEVAFALPFTFEQADYVQILTDIATRLGPALGWRPATP
ncbi:putative monooxygenase [Actinacidiphila reveromycinica]|uniref:Putative monooxygenase n=1 Tax=Actinacidiphila reveromycinica TaxID=659352 RepID=A0A7U3UYP6_9ACTN|nr:LLM class flavin-dependent oxidoreductase [Streptomyces sp. SN-593]BBB01198.1 putative monooxygenase [Streptomyces sp. SN-593]